MYQKSFCCAFNISEQRLTTIVDLDEINTVKEVCKPVASNCSLTIWGDFCLLNRDFLTKKLLDFGVNKESSDGWLVLAAYCNWGEKFLDYLDGEFAFVIFDIETNRIIAARDHVGIVPLFYYLTDRDVVFSDTITHISHSAVTATDELNGKYINAYLLDLLPSPEETPFEHVHSLLPGHIFVLGASRVRVERYWSVNGGNTAAEPSTYLNQLYHLCEQAVQKRVENCGSIGISLSGGLDSSSISCLLSKKIDDSKHLRKDIFAVSKSFKGSDRDLKRNERHFAQLVLDQTGFSGVFCDTEVENPLGELKEYYESRCSFPLNPFIALYHPVYEEFTKRHIQTIFIGTGGDDFASMSGLNISRSILSETSLSEAIAIAKLFAQNYKLSFITAFRVLYLSPLLPRKVLNLYRRCMRPTEFNYSSLSFVQESSEITLLKKEKLHPERPDTLLSVSQQVEAAMSNGFLQRLLEVDRYHSERNGFRFSFPLLDKEIVRFCAGVPGELFLLGGWKRGLFREAMKNTLPKEICWRKSKSFSSKPYIEYVRAAEVAIRAGLSQKTSKVWQYINPDKLETWLDHYCSRGENESETSELVSLKIAKACNVMQFIQWLEERAPEGSNS